jgi:hypothetical protein
MAVNTKTVHFALTYKKNKWKVYLIPAYQSLLAILYEVKRMPYVETPPSLHLVPATKLFIMHCQKIHYRGSLKKLLSQSEFRENQQGETRSILQGEYKIFPTYPTFFK